MKSKIIHGDAIEEMRKMETNSVDTIITDPPYLIGFMSKGWDKQDSSFHYNWAKEALRVAKPGATMLVFGGTRTYHRLACAIEDAGWILKDCIMWLYGSGFPKATDISKQLDKGYERKIVGEKKSPDGVPYSQRQPKEWKPQGFAERKNYKREMVETNPTTPEAKLWNGWKSHGLKPAYEPIIVAMKSNEGTYAENAIKWGVSGLNIDGGRIENKDRNSYGRDKELPHANITNSMGKFQKVTPYDHTKGRFPANLILDEEAAKILDKQSGELSSHGGGTTRTRGIPFSPVNKQRREPYPVPKGDKGGASRYFKVIK